MNRMVYLIFQLIIINKTVECRVSKFATLNQILCSIQNAMKDELAYDFSQSMVMDGETLQCLLRSKTIEDSGFGNGKILIVL